MPDDLLKLDPIQWHNRRLSALKTERSSFESHWRDIADHLLPRRSRFQTSDYNKGSKKNDKIIDSTGTYAANILVSGLMTGITSPARKWFTFVPPDPELREFGPVKEWLDLAERIMYDIFRASNLYQILPSVYEELVAFGTAVLTQTSDFDTVTTFGTYTVGEYWIAQDSKHRVRTIYRKTPMTVDQIVERYGDKLAPPSRRWANISQHVRSLYDSGNYDAPVDTIHVLHENPDYAPGSQLSREFRYEQLVYEDGTNEQKFLRRSGFKRFPAHTIRWHLMPPDVYGRSPGMDALGDIQQLQEQHKRKGQALAKHVNPPMVASPALKQERMTTLPGDVTFADLQQGDSFKPAYQTLPQLRDFSLDMEDCRQRIRRAFYSDLFLIITERPGVQPLNESEIFERKEEKLLALGPVLERVDDELLEPLINNTFAQIVENDLLPPPPQELQGVELRVEYLNIIAMAQRAQGLLGLQDTAAFVSQLGQAQAASGQEVTVWDKFDVDQAIDEYSEKRGLPAGVIRSDDEVKARRAARAQAQQQQTALAQADQLAQTAKALGDVDTTQRNLVTDLGAAARGAA